jgi:hypothetical protein
VLSPHDQLYEVIDDVEFIALKLSVMLMIGVVLEIEPVYDSDDQFETGLAVPGDPPA